MKISPLAFVSPLPPELLPECTVDKLPTPVKEKARTLNKGPQYSRELFPDLLIDNEAYLNLAGRFRIRYRKFGAFLQRSLMLVPCPPPVLQYLAKNGKTELIRLEAARRLNSNDLLVRLAYEAVEEEVRLKAALLSREQVSLAAFALKAWDINMGQMAVSNISNDFLLLRIAQSARQDAIRFSAGKKLGRPKLLKCIAEDTPDIHVRWQIAMELNDPHLLAQIAHFQRSNDQYAPLRLSAYNALIKHCDDLKTAGKNTELTALFFSQIDIDILVDILGRLEPEAIKSSLLRHLARNSFQYSRRPVIFKMLEKIRSSGWRIDEKEQAVSCPHCFGKGWLTERSVTLFRRHYNSEALPCSECNASGRIIQNIATCSISTEESVVFSLPQVSRR